MPRAARRSGATAVKIRASRRAAGTRRGSAPAARRARARVSLAALVPADDRAQRGLHAALREPAGWRSSRYPQRAVEHQPANRLGGPHVPGSRQVEQLDHRPARCLQCRSAPASLSGAHEMHDAARAPAPSGDPARGTLGPLLGRPCAPSAETAKPEHAFVRGDASRACGGSCPAAPDAATASAPDVLDT